eukprot:gene2397-5344_t
MADKLLYEAVVHPGASIGPFLLGSNINTVIDFLSQQFETFQKIDFVYSDQHLDYDLVLNISKYCLQLRFDPKTQCLKSIEVYGFKNIRLKYEFSQACGNSFKMQVFYPSTRTHAEFDPKRRAYFLEYPGLRLTFNVPNEWVNEYAQQHEDLAQTLVFPDGSSAYLSSLVVFGGPRAHQIHVPSELIVKHAGLNYFEVVHLNFGDTCQDALALLGPPKDIFYKSEDKTKIFSKMPANQATDFFLNYPSLGIDILFDGLTKRISKFVLHTNLPGHFDFGQYAKCNFQLIINKDQIKSESSSQSIGASVVLDQPQPQSTALTLISLDDHEDSESCSTSHQDDIKVNPEMQWETARKVLGSVLTKEVVYNHPLTPNTSNPFGPTTLWGIEGAIFEVVSTGKIATVTLFTTKSAY